ncbi:MAG: VWA domain-containing protein [Vicinamibacterales bacterium]
MTPRRRFLGRVGAAAAGIWAGGRPRVAAAAQARAADPRVFRADVELVTTPVTVTDAAGRLVATLDATDFVVTEDGLPQPIAHFSRERVPVSLCLVLDTSDSMFGQRIVDARAALAEFLDHLLEPEDETALVLFNHRPLVASSWTTDRSRLHARLDDVTPSGGTAIYDAVKAALPLFDARRHPRAAVVLVSDGADTASDTTVVQLRADLLRSDAFVYAIAIDSSDARPSARVNPWALREMTAQSGGSTEVISTAADLGPATARIADELNHQYMIGFTRTRKPDGEYHTLRVSVRGGDYRVRSRRGYVARKATDASSGGR